jgi:hypothetical protein
MNRINVVLIITIIVLVVLITVQQMTIKNYQKGFIKMEEFINAYSKSYGELTKLYYDCRGIEAVNKDIRNRATSPLEWREI